MVTKDSLFQNILELKEKEIQDKLESDRRHVQYLEEKLIKDTQRVQGLLNGDLGILLKKLNEYIFHENRLISKDDFHYKFHNKIKIDSYKTHIEYHCVDKWGHPRNESEYRDYNRSDFQLGFSPNPEYAPTKLLIELLTEAGFKAEAVTEQCDNWEYEPYGDGEYNIVKTGGTHPEYHIVIEW